MNEDVLDQAITWLVKLESAQHAPALCAACLAWRQADPQHESAWQALQEAQVCFDQARELPRGVAMGTLASPAQASRRHALKLLTLGLLGLGAGGSALQHSPWRVSLADYSTATGERRRVALADGSELQLNSRSAVDVHFSQSQRQLHLREGQVYFKAAADALHRPFSVTTEQAMLLADDAAFDVCQLAGRTCLGVDHGAVTIHLPGLATVHASPGEQYLIDGSGARPVADPQPDGSAWTRGLLIATRLPLKQVAESFAAQRAGWIGCDPAVAGLRVSGVFQLDDTDNALRSLPHTLPVRLQWRSSLWVRIVPA